MQSLIIKGFGVEIGHPGDVWALILRGSPTAFRDSKFKCKYLWFCIFFIYIYIMIYKYKCQSMPLSPLVIITSCS
jgi:hypothetical protein